MSTNTNTLKIYWSQVKKFRISFFLAMVLIPTYGLLLETMMPFYLSKAIAALAEQNYDLVYESIIIAGIFAAAGIVANVIGFYALSQHEWKARASLSDYTFAQLINKSYLFFANEKIGALTSRYNDFIRAHVMLQDILIIRTLPFILILGGGLFLVAAQSLLLAGILLILIVIILIEVRIGLKIRSPYRHRRKKMVGEVYGQAADVITNNIIVKTFASESEESKRLSQKNYTLGQLFKKDIDILGYEGGIRHVIMTMTQLGGILLAVWLVSQGRIELSIAIFALAYLQRLSAQLFELGTIINGYDQAFLDAAPMSAILSDTSDIIDQPNAKELVLSSGSITLSKVSFTHDKGQGESVFKNFDLHIDGGSKVGIVGHSGSGKSTLTSLLLRFADVDTGSISFDGQNIANVTQYSLRTSIAYVPQEPALFHRSLFDNIAYGKQDATLAEVTLAAKQANALEFIERLPEGFDTTVGERGVKLSGGQRQRVAIARAVLKDAPILILDEATSALDSISENLIQESLWKLMQGRTTLVIAHRLSTIQKMDRIIVMDNGSIVEDGSHIELLRRGGVYANLWSHQSGGFIEE